MHGPILAPERGVLPRGRKGEAGRRALFIVVNVMDVVAPRETGHQGKTLVSAEHYHLLVFGRLSASKGLSFFIYKIGSRYLHSLI